MDDLEQLAGGSAEPETKVETKVEGEVEQPEQETPEQIKAKEIEAKKQSDFKELRKHNKELLKTIEAERERAIKAEERARVYESMQNPLRSAEPKFADFNGDAEAYAEAKSAYLLARGKGQESEATTKQQAEAKKAQEQAQIVNEEFNEQIAIRLGVDPDLTKALENINKNGIGEGIDARIEQAIKVSPVGVEIVKFLGLNPEFTSALEELPLNQQAVRLRVLEKEALRVGNLDHLSKKTQKTEVPPKVNAQGGGSIKPRLDNPQSQADFAKAFRSSLQG
jgi:hypothetical protein